MPQNLSFVILIDPNSFTAPVMNLPTVAVPPPSALKGKTLEEIVNRWSSDLETHAREFNRYAAEVAVWDRALIENGNTVSLL
jgi:nuclear pore complex protein Nup62